MAQNRKYRRYTKTMLKKAVQKSVCYSEVLSYFGIKKGGGAHRHLRDKIRGFGIDTSHFLGQASNAGERYKGGTPKKSWQEILVYRDEGRERAVKLRRALIEMGRAYHCESPLCTITDVWLGKTIILHVDHKDGNQKNCLPENLRFLCPNCHSQTPNFSGTKGGTTLTSTAKGMRDWRKRKHAVVGELADPQG